jgi:hypothetical protein
MAKIRKTDNHKAMGILTGVWEREQAACDNIDGTFKTVL